MGVFCLRVDDANVAMSNRHTYVEQYSREETLKVWTDGAGSDASVQASAGDVVQLSDQAKALALSQPGVNDDGSDEDSLVLTASPQDKLKAMIIQRLIEVLTGKKIKIRLSDDVKISRNEPGGQADSSHQAAAIQQPQRQGWGLQYDASETYTEQEQMIFTAEGVIRTNDGREIRFSAQLNLSREFIQTQSISLRAGDAARVDPLVINFDGNAAALTDDRFNFDLNSDGKQEQISFVRPGSGFLVLDQNSDGKIDRGTDLFGPSSGNGFAELSRFDADGNGWIDEGDPVYSKLRIWSRDAQGNDSLSTLGEKGIGAIFLGNVDSQFDLKDKENALQGEVRRTGIYVTESGSAGTIQQVDLTL